MTNKFYAAVVAGTAIAAVTLGASSANAATATANATANIVQALTITQNTQLNFATIVPGAAAANVDIDTAGARTCGAGLTCSGTAAAGAFTVTGTANQAINYSVSAPTTLTGPGTAMALSGLTASGTGSATLSGAGTTTFTVGGTLTVGANQAAGVYSGTYTVTANYQ